MGTLPSNQSILDRRTAYARCSGRVAHARILAEAEGRKQDAEKLWHQQQLIEWALGILCAYVLDGEEATAEWIPSDDDVCCAIRLVDPCCVKCKECDPPAPAEPYDCSITPDYTAIAVDVSFFGSAVPGVMYLIVSNTGNVANAWSTHVDELVMDGVFTVPTALDVIEDPNTGILWTIAGSRAGHLFPLIDAVHVIGGDYYLVSQYPLVNNALSRNILIEATVDGTSWDVLYQGPENVLVDPYLVSGADGYVSIRTTYRYGLCSDGPFAGVVTEGELMDLTTVQSSTPFTFDVYASTGRVRVRSWDGVETVFGAGVPGSPITVSLPVPSSGAFSGGAAKQLFVWPVLGATGGVPTGALTRLEASGKSLIDADLSRADGIVSVNVTNNSLAALPLSPASSPTVVQASNNLLTSLVVPGTAAQTITASNNAILSVDFSAHLGLTSLTLNGNNIAAIDVTANTALTLLNLANNDLTSIDVSPLTSMLNLNLAGNELAGVDVSALVLMTDLYVQSNNITTMNTTFNVALLRYNCADNLLTALDVSTNTLLLDFRCNGNALGTIDVSNNTALQTFYCYSCSLTALDVTLNTALVTLLAYSNSLTALDITNNIALVTLNASTNAITALDPTNCVLLQVLQFNDNQLATIDLSGNPALRTCLLQDNLLTALGVTANGQIRTLQADNNNIGTIDLSASLQLQILYLNNCGLSALSVPSTALTQLLAQNNTITALNVSGKPSLTTLLVGNNVTMTTLNFSNTAVSSLGVAGNVALNTVQGVGAALSPTSVDGIFVPLNAAVPGTVTINGGTSSAPGPASLAQRTALVGGGWAITTN